ncbi:AfsR/SARP family transcriptional regulator [Catenulispora rubra]|uniref:AfsR/SARP family transcriptional regulator n=1 Tax=Catenulispora rubra TaxID=280293 RepID=UPI0018921724|nr:AfsR/SARP family transcriptional regulator [Catenulispora rubra]
MRLELLGPLRIWLGDREITLGAPKQRAVLAMLAMRAGEIVGVKQIIDGVWGDEIPTSAANCVHTYVASLRRILRPEERLRGGRLLASTGGGYVFDVGSDTVDVQQFSARVQQARALRSAGNLTDAVLFYEAAQGMWRGEALANVPGPFAHWERARLHETRISVLEEWATVMVAEGRHAETIGVLSDVVNWEPLRERLRWLLMVALFRSGRRADALRVYRDTRKVLRDELGIEPGPELGKLHEQILAGPAPAPRRSGTAIAVTDPATVLAPKPAVLTVPVPTSPFPAVAAEPATPAPAPQGAVALAGLAQAVAEPDASGDPHTVGTHDGARAGVDGPAALAMPWPAQLPPSARGFVGRAAELARLRGLVDRYRVPGMHTALVIEGAPGSGKTALALQVARGMADRHPDGQLFLDLRGSEAPMGAAQALATLLRSLGVPDARLPADLAGRTALYRSMLHGRRVLLVLDDAAGPSQVRPLIPRGPACVIVTSRRDQTVLAAREGALRLALGPLAGPEAVSLLSYLIDDEAAADHHSVLGELAEACGRLPLALRLAAESVACGTGPLADRVRALTEQVRGGRPQPCVPGTGPGSAAAEVVRAIATLTGADVLSPAAA